MPLTECRPAAALVTGCQLDLEPSRLEDFGSGNTYVRLVIPGEGVVPKHNAAASRCFRGRVSRKPAIETLAGKPGERTLPCNSKPLVRKATHQDRTQQRIGQPGNFAAPGGDLVDARN